MVKYFLAPRPVIVQSLPQSLSLGVGRPNSRRHVQDSNFPLISAFYSLNVNQVVVLIVHFHIGSRQRIKKANGVKLFTTISLVAALIMQGCTPMAVLDANATNEARVAATPKARPQRTITNFTRALQCMDDMFVRYNISNLLVGAQDILDPTAKERAPTKDMLITALSTMSQRSKAIRFVVLGYDLQDISTFHNLHQGKEFVAPDFFIRISPAQLDKGVSTERYGGGIRVQDYFSAELNKDRLLSIISLDMNLGVVKNLQMLPGLSSANSIAVVRRSTDADFSGTIKKFGALFNMSFDASEGTNHSLRTLVDLGAIELMGSLAQVPYWECLDIESNSPQAQEKIINWYKSLAQEELRIFIQSKLEALKFYSGPVNGKDNQAFRHALAVYKGKSGLIADSNMDFAVYYQLITDPTPIKSAYLPKLTQRLKDPDAPPSEQRTARIVPQNIGLDHVSVKPLILNLTTNRGVSPVYRAGELMSIRVSVSTDAHVYCYYQQASGEVLKLFPNRYVPNAKVSADTELFIPGGHFRLIPEKPRSKEQIMCMASYTDIDSDLPAELSKRNLQIVPVANLEAVYQYYKMVSSIVPLRKTIDIEVR